MNKILLKSIDIQNFKGISSAHIEFDSKQTVLTAPNHSGKTSIRNAFEWCFCKNINDFIPKINNKEVYGLTTKVTLVLQVGDADYTIERQSVGKYSKNEETGKEEKTTNTSKYYIDGLEYNQSKYISILAGLLGIDNLELLPILINKDEFMNGNNKFDWRHRRKLLLKLAGADNASLEIASQEEFVALKPYIVKGYAISDIKSSLEKERKSLKTQQEKNMVLIEQKTLENQELNKEDYNVIREDIKSLEQQLEEARLKTANELDSEKIQELSSEIRTKMSMIEKLQLQDTITQTKQREYITQLYNDAKSVKLDIDRKTIDLADLQKQHEYAKNNKVDTACPVCGTPYSEELTTKSKKDNKDHIKNLTAQVKECEKVLAELKDKYNNIKTEYNEKVAELNNFAPNEQINELQIALETLRKALEEEKHSSAITLSTDTEKSILEAIKRKQTELAKESLIATNQKQIDDWKASSIQVADKILNIDRQLNLLDRFTKAEINSICDKVNQMFPQDITFSMFKENYNGTLDYECTPLYNNVRYESLSTGEQLVTNMAIQETLQNGFDINLPIFIDNYECLTIPFTSNRQLICLQVGQEKNFKLETIKDNINKEGE